MIVVLDWLLSLCGPFLWGIDTERTQNEVLRKNKKVPRLLIDRTSEQEETINVIWSNLILQRTDETETWMVKFSCGNWGVNVDTVLLTSLQI